jgi:outer membrane protease
MKYRWLAVAVLLVGVGGAGAMNVGNGLPVETNKALAVSFQGSLGLLNGSAQENVYSGVNGRRYHLSELDWDIKNVALAGVQASVVWLHTVWLNAGLWGAATKGNGQMNDWDWLLNEFGSPWTDWSLSNVDVERAWLLDLNIAVELLRTGHLGLRGIAGYKYNGWKWQDYGVQHVYSSDPARPGGFRNDVRNDPPETAIVYEQNYHIPYLGVGANFRAGRWVLDASVLFSPFVYASDHDQHLYRELVFDMTMNKGGTYAGANLRALWLWTEHLYLSAALDAQIIPELSGDLTVTDLQTGEKEFTSNAAGISHQSWMLSLGLGGRF